MKSGSETEHQTVLRFVYRSIAFEDFVEDEHHGWGRHVSVISKDVSRSCERVGWKLQRIDHSIENPRSTRMHDPVVDLFDGNPMLA